MSHPDCSHQPVEYFGGFKGMDIVSGVGSPAIQNN